MSLEYEFFKRSRPVFDRLESFGFKKTDGAYVFVDSLPGGDFRAELTVAEDGSISGQVIDEDTDEEYTPIRLRDPIGGFAGTIKADYLDLLDRVRQACFVPVSFIFDQSNRMEARIHREFGAAAEFPWEKYPGNGSFKCLSNGKWFALVLTVAFGKLGTGTAKAGSDVGSAPSHDAGLSHDADPSHDAEEIVEVVNLKADPDVIPALVCRSGIYPAWHMNKKHWISVILDDTLFDDEVFELISESHRLVSTTKNKKVAGTGAWMIPSNPKIYDVDAGFREGGGVIEWHQHNDIHVGDEVYIYSTAPNSAIMYRCDVVADDLKYKGMFRDKEHYRRSMRIRLLEKYPPDRYPLSFIKAHGGSVVRSARTMPAELHRAILKK